MPMRVVQIDQFCEEPDEVDWLVDSLLADTGWTLFYGISGLGKSTFALQLCESLQTGVTFLNRVVKPTRFLYVQADGSAPEWRAMCKRIAPRSVGKCIVDVPTYALDNPAYVDYIHNAIRHVNPGFVVYDSLYSLTAVDINTPKILMTVNVMKQLALSNTIPWMLIHHPIKSDPSCPAGSASLTANCSNDWSLTKTKLSIRKGRLVKDKEVLLTQDEEYLWHLYTRPHGQAGSLPTSSAYISRARLS